MASEATRNLVRVIMNYLRLGLTLCLGIIYVRLVFRAVGADGFGLIGLLGSASGVSSIFQAVVQRSMIRELGRAYHTDDPGLFLRTYNSALVLTWLAVPITGVMFFLMYLCLPFFSISDELRPAAGWFLLAMACLTGAIIAFSAPMNMYMVKERMAAYNTWLVIERASYTLAAVVILYFTETGVGQEVVVYGFCAAGFVATVHFSGSLMMMMKDRRMVPRIGHVNTQDMKSVLGVGGWNTGVVASLSMHHHADNLIMNFWFGLFGNAVFTLAIRLTGYVRMFATGMTTGLDAVSARISSGDEQGGRLARLIYHSARMHGLAAFPAILTMCLLAEPLLRLWIAKTLADPEAIIPTAVTVTWAMGVGITCHAIGDGWITVLYGAGHIRRYAPLVIAGGVANPIIAVTLLTVLPDNLVILGPALGYSLIMLVVHFILLPVVTARVVGVRVYQIYLPLLSPLLTSLAAAPVFIIALKITEEWSLPRLILVLAVYYTIFAGLSYLFVLSKDERQRCLRLIHRTVNRVPRGEAGNPQVKG